MAVSKVQKVEMSEEMAKSLRGILPISMDTRRKITPKVFDKIPKEFRPTFTLRPMTKAEKMRFSRSEVVDFLSGDDVLFDCIDGAENLWNVETRSRFDEWTRDIFDSLNPSITSELASELLNLSCLTSIEAVGLK
jgi:hypothetical protein